MASILFTEIILDLHKYTCFPIRAASYASITTLARTFYILTCELCRHTMLHSALVAFSAHRINSAEALGMARAPRFRRLAHWRVRQIELPKYWIWFVLFSHSRLLTAHQGRKIVAWICWCIFLNGMSQLRHGERVLGGVARSGSRSTV